MSAWIASIAGVVILGVLIDVLLPEGESNKYVKGVYALIVILVVVSPVARFFNSGVDMGSIFDEEVFETDDSFHDYVNGDRKEQDRQNITNSLKKSGFENAVVVIFQSTGDIYKVDRVNVDITNCPYNVDQCEDKIIEIVKNCVNCEEVRVYDNK